MDTTLVLLISPLIVLQIALQLYALYDVLKRSSTREATTTVLWVLIILMFNLLGPILYFALARRDREVTV
jgi:heme/copper-type cytochrome/quinol oxidase subunit 4